MTIAMTDGSTYENQLDMLFAKDMPSREETQGPMPAVDMPKRLAQPNTYTPNEEDQLSNPIAPQIKDQNDPYSWGMGTAIDEKGLAKVPNPTPKFHEIMDQMDQIINPEQLPVNAQKIEASVTPEQQAQLFTQSEKTQAPEKTLTETHGPSGYGETYDKFVDALDAASKHLNPSFIPTAEQFRDAPWKEKLGFIIGTSMMLAAPGRSGIRTLPKESPTTNPLDFWKENLQAYKNLEHPAEGEAFNNAVRENLASKEFTEGARAKMEDIQSSREEWNKINPEGKGKWSPDEEALLRKSLQDGRTVKDIANISGRTQSSIRSKAKSFPKGITPTEDLNKALDENTGYSPEFEDFMKAREENRGNNPGYAGKDFTDRFAFDRKTLPKAETDLTGKSGISTPNKVPEKAANRNDNFQIDDPVMDAAIDKTWENFGRANKDNLPLISPEIEAKLHEMNPVATKKLKQFETEMDYKYKQPPGRRHWLSDLTEAEANRYRKLYNDIDKIRPIK